ncbi:transcriptional regulator with XRE-family HTH domain [Paenibacillus endophyticus]|uniref:Transcriptional regulator with XRE-family HTH domain n=1 Tax=Paenibacillus endophyticus TaxID=1294268 RepID=A0A7W5C7G0_9BACL|nr:helix-turn-helix transcriptional regulator [Paenibacillus endophyticus]MBB3152533.1 transcriptional regulator with XRE-family HTH domain [Paenibacillus endophyticus]
MSLGARIKQLRTERGLTQQDVATHLDMGRSNLGHIENDRVMPTSEDLQKLADILQTTTDFLLGRDVAAADIPEWATYKDKRDFKKLLEEDGEIMFDGVPMSPVDRQRVMDVLTGLFWEAKQMNKHKKKSESAGDAPDDAKG